MPVASKRARLGGVNVRHEDVENSAWPQPFAHSSHHAPWLIEMFKHVKAGNGIERFTGKRCVQNMSDEDLRAGLSLRDFRALGGHLDTVQVPPIALQRLQKRS